MTTKSNILLPIEGPFDILSKTTDAKFIIDEI